MKPHKPYIPGTISELIDMLSMMMISSPTFVDNSGYFPERNVGTVFFQFNESPQLLRGRLGEALYLKLTEMSDRMRAHFEADPEDKTDDGLKGRGLIVEMQDLLKQRTRNP
jgi:hypothetical protein